jgi:hypothetical protein
MRKRPLSLYLCALLFLYFPLEFALRYYVGHPVRWFDIILEIGLPAILLIGLIRVERFGWYTLIAVVALWGTKDLYEHYASRTTRMAPLIAHLFIYVVSLGYFINPRIRTLYFDPKKRWWKSKPRFETHLPFMLHNGMQWAYPIMRNISETGCFVETSHPAEMGSRLNLTIPLPIPLNLSVIRVEGIVRWVAGEKTPNRGMGLEFVTPPAEQSQAIREFVKRQL